MWVLKFLEERKFDGSIMDFGGGDGDFALAAAACGYDTTYFETSEENIEFVKWRIKRLASNLKIITELDGKKFDCVTAFDVTEHFQDIAKFIEMLNLLIVPNNNSYFIETSSFSFRSTGHFDIYNFRNEVIPAKAVNRRFRTEMRLKYEMVDHGWNSRPVAWKHK